MVADKAGLRRQFMKSLLIGLLAAAVFSGIAVAQGTTPQTGGTPQTQQTPATGPGGSASATSPTTRIAAGSVIPVQLVKTIDAKKAKTGDEVEAKVTQDMKTANGEIIVPKDTMVTGHITEAQPRNKEQKESEVGIAFDHAALRTGGNVTVPMSIQAVISQSYLNPVNNNAAQDTGSATPESGGMPSGTNGGGRPSMGGGSAQPQAQSSGSGDQMPTDSKTPAKARPQITGNTQGVLGISNLKLSSEDAQHASVLSSEKNNVKLENGTLLLLRVNP
jgi:hypothetical protein